MVDGLGPLPEKKNIFRKIKNLGAFYAVFIRQKHGQSLEALGHGFYCSIAKRSLQKQSKNYRQNSHSGEGEGAITPSPPP